MIWTSDLIPENNSYNDQTKKTTIDVSGLFFWAYDLGNFSLLIGKNQQFLALGMVPFIGTSYIREKNCCKVNILHFNGTVARVELLILNDSYLTFSFLSNLRLSFSVIQDHKFSVVFKQHLSSCYHCFPYSFIIQSNLKSRNWFYLCALYSINIHMYVYWLIYITHVYLTFLIKCYMYTCTRILASVLVFCTEFVCL